VTETARTGYVPRPGTIPTLPVPDLARYRRLHLVGIGGKGMSSLARILVARGFEVSGSDLKESPALADLAGLGATVSVGHHAEHLDAPSPPDAVVISSAIREENIELREARSRGLPVLARAQILAALSRGRRTIAVAGTAGKTTTTSMIAVVLERAGLDPTYVIGGDLNESGSGARHGEGPWLVAEADESDGSFLLLRPEIAVVTNVEADHLDFYSGGVAEIEAAFARFVEGARTVVACGDDQGVRAALALSGARAATYGVRDGNEALVKVSEASGRVVRGTLELDGHVVDLEVRVPGAHYLLNAAAAILSARAVGIEPSVAAEALLHYPGVGRRFEFRGMARGAEFYDDYAHHPTKITAMLASVPSDYARVIAVLQPLRHTRTAAMWRALGESMGRADVVVVSDIYGAGEDPIPGVTAKLIVDALAEAQPTKRILYLPHLPDVVDFLVGEVRTGDFVVTLAGGDVTMAADQTVARILEGA